MQLWLYLLEPVESPDVVEGVDAGTQPTVQAEDLTWKTGVYRFNIFSVNILFSFCNLKYFDFYLILCYEYCQSNVHQNMKFFF